MEKSAPDAGLSRAIGIAVQRPKTYAKWPGPLNRSPSIIAAYGTGRVQSAAIGGRVAHLVFTGEKVRTSAREPAPALGPGRRIRAIRVIPTRGFAVGRGPSQAPGPSGLDCRGNQSFSRSPILPERLTHARAHIAGAPYFTKLEDLPAKSRSHDGKIPSTSVPRAGRINAAPSPGDNGSAVVAASLGSCMYIATRIRR